MTRKKIDKQVSEGDIYNILGDFNLNSGTLQVENLILEGNQGVESALIKAEQDKLATSNSISYIDFIRQQFKKKVLVDREAVKEILQRSASVDQLMISAEPGTGKTCTLFQLSALYPESIYISVRNRSSLFVFNHLINKLRIRRHEALLSADHIDEAFEILQSLLLSSNITFLIDDCESAVETVSKLIDLHKAGNKFLFATRNAQLFTTSGIEGYQLKAFTADEIGEYLALCKIELDHISFNRLCQASDGNALYLFYYSKYQIDPLPSDIESFHRVIWYGLSAEDQEGLIFMALAFHPLTIEDLSSLMGDKRPTDTSARLLKLASLVNREDGKLQIFHAAFREYIIKWLESEGHLINYSERLANYFLDKDRLIDAAWLLIDINPSKVNEFGISAVHAVIVSGDLHFATKLINTLLLYERPAEDTGYLEYHLSTVYRYLYQEKLSDEHLLKAIQVFATLEDKNWLLNAEMIRAMNLVEKGDHEEGLKLVDSIFERSKERGDSFWARYLTNLSRIYMELSEYGKAAKTAKEAFDIFEKLNELDGLAFSLANLTSSLTKLDDYTDLAETYALKLLDLSGGNIEFGIRLVALNALTSIKRIKKNYGEAKKYCNEAIQLCQQYNLPDRMVLNLINYGNILRSEKDLKGAIKIYEEALGHIYELGLDKEGGRVYWILSSVYRELNDFPNSIAYADKSIDVCRKFNHQYGIGHALEEKAKALEKAGEKTLAAQAYEESANIFLTIDNFSADTKESFSKAIQLYFEIGEVEQANKLLAQSIMDVPHVNSKEIDYVLQTGKGVEPLTVHQGFKMLAEKYSDPAFTQNTIRKFLVYLDYCQKNSEESYMPFLDVLKSLARNAGSNRFALTILAILIEQSKNLLSEDGLTLLMNVLRGKLPGFYIRETFDKFIILAVVSNKLKIHLEGFRHQLLPKKLIVAVVLFWYAAPELFSGTGAVSDPFFKMVVSDLDEVVKEGYVTLKEGDLSDDIQVVLMADQDNRSPMYVYVNSDYEKMADLILFPENKCFMYLLGMSVLQLILYFFDENIGDDSIGRKGIVRKIAFFFDYTNLEDLAKGSALYSINLNLFK